MKGSKKIKKHQSPKTERTYPSADFFEETPLSPGRGPSKQSFLSLFRSHKPTLQEPLSVASSGAGRVTPEQSERRGSIDKQKSSQENSPKSITVSLASSTYRNISQSFTDFQTAITSRSKPSSPDIEAIAPPLLSPLSSHGDSPPPEKPVLLPFRIESIQRQGWLNRRPDSDFKRSKSGSGTIWKLQRAIVHDSRLYLYTPPSSLGIRAFVPTPTSAPSELSPPLGSVPHIKHSHSPSEGIPSMPGAGQASLADLERRPSTAPHALATEPDQKNDLDMPSDTNELIIENVRLDDEQRIVGGTMSAICNHILCSAGPEALKMNEDCRIFCTTIGFWAPIEVILLEMTQIASQKNHSDKLDAIIKFWCDSTPRIMWDEGASEALLVLIEEGVTRVDQERGLLLNDYVVQAEKKFKNLLQSYVDIDNDEIQDYIESSGLLDQGLTGSVLLQIPTEVIAEQLFIFHLRYLVAVDPAQDMSLLLDRSACQRFRSPLVFSQQVPHFLTRLVHTHVLGLDAPEACSDVSLRASFLTRWIEIGQAMKLRRDLSGFLAIAAAILSIPILRLKETWTDVDPELRSMIVRDWSPMMKELHRRDLGADTGLWTPHVLTPDLQREDLSSHLVIPYYGDICTALEGFDIWAVTPDTDVDFLQVREAFTSAEHAISIWVNFKKEAVGEQQSPESVFLKRSRALQACFEELHSSFAEGFPYSSDQLFEASLQVEPPLQGAYIEHHYAKRLSVTSGSYVPLILTDVLPSYKLFEQTDLLEALATVDKRSLYSGGQAMARQHRERPTTSSASAWAGRGNKPSPLRRTNSYPPTRTSLATTGNADLDYSTHNRIAGLTSRHFPMLKTLRDIAGVEQSLLHVQDGELVLKVVTDIKRMSRPGSMIIETSSKRASLASKRSSVQVFGTPSPGRLSMRNSFPPENATMNTTDVVTKAGSLDRLVDVLVLGIEEFSTYLLEDNIDSNGKKPLRLQMNIDEFRTTFLATFRSFCSPTVLMEYLRKRFIGAVYVAAHVNEDEDSEDFSELFPDWTPIEPLDNDKVDWQLVGKIQCGVLDTISVWISQYFSDFLNTPNLGAELIRFLKIVQKELLAWDEVYKTKPYVSYFSNQIGSMAKGIRKTFSVAFYKPAHYPSSFRTPEDLISMPVAPLALSQPRADQFDALFNDLDESLMQLYRQVSMEDWMATFEVFEVQSTDICGFYYPNGYGPIREEDTRLRTIFTVLRQIQRPKSHYPLIDVLPRPLRQLHRLHENLVAWILAQVSDTSINIYERISRIQSLIAFLRSSRQRMSYLDFYTTEQTVRLTEERGENRLGVPSFIASAIAAALVSPESRAFGRAWIRVFEEDEKFEPGRPQTYDTLADFVYRRPTTVDIGSPRTLTPCLGWIMERMLEIACYVPNMSLESTRLINFDKRRYIFNLISNIVPPQDDLDLDPLDQHSSMDSFTLQLVSSDLFARRIDFRLLRDIAAIEWNIPEQKVPRLFRSLVADEQRKNRRDQRRRHEIEKQIRDHQKSRPSGIREAPSQPDLREAARSGRDANRARGARERFLRTIRPLSIAIGSHSFGEKPEPRVVKVEELPKSMNIPPGTRAAQKLSLDNAMILSRIAYEKEHVFSIRTEEGHECWLQGVDAEDATAWVQLLSAISVSTCSRGHHKSKEVTPEPVKAIKAADPVFGVKLEVLLEREGRELPWVVVKLLDDIERRGLDEVGLYRVPGAVSSVKALMNALNSGEDVDMDDERWIDVNVVAGTFKSWLRELPEPILTNELFDKFIHAVGIREYEEKCYAVRSLVHQLPTSNFNLLKRVIQHLKLVADNEPINHMNAPNLAICVAPVIVTSARPGSFAGTMESMGRAQALVRDLIIQYEWVFDDDEEVEQEADVEDGEEEEATETTAVDVEVTPEIPTVMSV